MLIHEQFDLLYNLSLSKTTFGKMFGILEVRFSRKPHYKDLWGFLTLIFEISTVDNLQLSTFS